MRKHSLGVQNKAIFAGIQMARQFSFRSPVGDTRPAFVYNSFTLASMLINSWRLFEERFMPVDLHLSARSSNQTIEKGKRIPELEHLSPFERPLPSPSLQETSKLANSHTSCKHSSTLIHTRHWHWTTYQSLPSPLVASVMVHRRLNRPRTENAPETLLETSKPCTGKHPRKDLLHDVLSMETFEEINNIRHHLRSRLRFGALPSGTRLIHAIPWGRDTSRPPIRIVKIRDAHHFLC